MRRRLGTRAAIRRLGTGCGDSAPRDQHQGTGGADLAQCTWAVLMRQGTGALSAGSGLQWLGARAPGHKGLVRCA